MIDYGGTECYVRDLAIALKSIGIEVEIYSPHIANTELSDNADENIVSYIKSLGINIVNSVNDIKNVPDVIHGHHQVTIDVINKFPYVPVIFFCHSIDAYSNIIIHNNIKKYVAVSHYISEMVLEPHIAKENISIIYNWVDTHRFIQKSKVNNIAKKALIFGNHFSSRKKDVIFNVCGQKNIALSCIGLNNGLNIKSPEEVLQNYDIVFAIGKSAIESMACGCAVILCGFDSLMGQMIESNNFEYCRKYNFGLKNLTKEISEQELINEIEKYNSIEINKVSNMIREKSNSQKIFNEIIMLYNEVINNNNNLGC